jgi:anthraniloyl-CoA monooxygenase
VRVLVIGGGPGGLYTALLIKRRDPLAHVEVIDRNRPDDTFGWGVVLSDLAVANLHAADPESAVSISNSLHHWDDIEVHFAGRKVRSGGHGFSGIGRHRLLAVLQQRCRELGVRLSNEYEVFADTLEHRVASDRFDVVVAADGINSSIRNRYAATYKPDTDVRRCRYVWLGTPRRFDAFTFAFAETPSGWFQAHAYQFAADASTFIVETPWEVWAREGLENMSAEESFCWAMRHIRRTSRLVRARGWRWKMRSLSTRSSPHTRRASTSHWLGTRQIDRSKCSSSRTPPGIPRNGSSTLNATLDSRRSSSPTHY